MDNSLFDRLINIALEDGMISQDETKLLRSVFENYDKYMNFLNKALEDGIITPSEQKSLIKRRSHMLHDAYDTASEDKKITESEFNMLQEILNLIYKLELDEHKIMEL